MKEQLCFDFMMLKNRMYLLWVMVILDLLYFALGLAISVVPLRFVFMATILVNGVITCIFMYSLNTHTNQAKQVKTNALSCMYFPTTPRVYMISKYIYTFLLLLVQLFISGISMVVGAMLSHDSISFLAIGNILVDGVVTIFILSSLMMISSCLVTNFLNVLYVLVGGISGGLVSVSNDMGELSSKTQLLVEVLIFLLLLIIIFEISRFIISRRTP